MASIFKIPIRYDLGKLLRTATYGMTRSQIYGMDFMMSLGSELEYNHPVSLYKYVHKNTVHILASPEPIDWKRFLNKQIDPNVVCLYSKYHQPNKNSILCRYLPNYLKLLMWVTGEPYFSVESILANATDSMMCEYGLWDNPSKKEYFVTDQFISAFDVINEDFIVDNSELFYKIRNNIFHPNLMANPASLKRFIRANSVDVHPEPEKPTPVESKNQANDSECINYILHLPLKKLVCIYYCNEQKLDLQFVQCEGSIDQEKLSEVLINICKLYASKTEKVLLNYEDEEITIQTDSGKHYINIPILDLINQLVSVC